MDIIGGLFLVLTTAALLYWLCLIPRGIYGMVIRMCADSNTAGAFPYSQYFTLSEARKYAIITALCKVPKIALVMCALGTIVGLVIGNGLSITDLVSLVVLVVLIFVIKDLRSKKMSAIEAHFGDNTKLVLSKMFSIGIGRWLWAIPAALTIVGLIFVILALLLTPKENNHPWWDDCW